MGEVLVWWMLGIALMTLLFSICSTYLIWRISKIEGTHRARPPLLDDFNPEDFTKGSLWIPAGHCIVEVPKTPSEFWGKGTVQHGGALLTARQIGDESPVPIPGLAFQGIHDESLFVKLSGLEIVFDIRQSYKMPDTFSDSSYLVPYSAIVTGYPLASAFGYQHYYPTKPKEEDD